MCNFRQSQSCYVRNGCNDKNVPNILNISNVHNDHIVDNVQIDYVSINIGVFSNTRLF